MAAKNILLYQAIVDDLKNKILSGIYKPEERLPTEFEIASKYGVSRITSKRALEELKLQGLIYRIRGSGSFVSQSLPKMNQSDDISTSCINNKGIITIMIPFDVSESSFAQSVRGASEILDENNFYINVYSGIRNLKAEQKLIKKLYEDNIKGIIYYPVSDRGNFEILNTLLLENYPIVTIDRYFEGLPINYVVSDNEYGAGKATQYLIDLGHKRVAFVSHLAIESTTSIRNRYFGYCKTLKRNNIRINSNLVKIGFADEQHDYYQKELYQNIIRELLTCEVTAIFAVNDLVATLLMRAAFELNIKIPEDISIIGFDDVELSKHLQVPLTTISQDFYNMGRTAAQMLVNEIRSGQREYNQVKLPVELIIRESCAEKLE